MNDRDIVQLSDIEHIRKFPGMYISSTEVSDTEEFILSEGKMEWKTVSYSKALLKIINEAIDNSVDEAIKTHFRYGNKIQVSIINNIVTVKDNGRGIPVKDMNGVPMPVIAFCSVRAGSNFTEDNKDTIGTHGIGIKAANIFSTDFRASTSDGKKRLDLHCTDHLSTKEWNTSSTSMHGTKVVFVPDLRDFHSLSIDDTIHSLIRQRLIFLSISYPKIHFTFNSKDIVSTSYKDVLSMFSSDNVLIDGDRWIIGIVPNLDDQFRFFTYVNGVYMQRGGTHIDSISQDLSYGVRDLLSKKYSSIKPADVKNKLCIIAMFRDFPDMRFDSQTKEALTNSVVDIHKYLGDKYCVQDICRSIVKNRSIIDNIIEVFRVKEELKRRREMKFLSSKVEVVSEKYFAPIGKKKYLMITEGYSAFAGISPILGRKDIAYYSLRGKPINTMDQSYDSIIKNQEFKDLIQILNIDVTDKDTDVAFDNVVCLSDSDIDGTHIASLLLVLFHNYAPKIIEEGRMKRLITPLIICFGKSHIPEKWFFSLDEYNTYSRTSSLDKYETKYYKGLGSFKGEELRYILSKAGGMESMLHSFSSSGISEDDKCLKKWFSSEFVDKRKEDLCGVEFNISSV